MLHPVCNFRFFDYFNPMKLENSGRINLLKKIFYPGAMIWAVLALVFFLTGKDVYGFISAIVLILWFLVFQFIDFQYILFDTGNDKIILRFYPAVKFGRKDYSAIEFHQQNLFDYRIEKSVFGLVNDLILVIRTPRGVADYPPVSMAALKKEEQQKIEQFLKKLLNR